MKNIFTRALALTMIVMLFAVTAFAANPTYTGVAYDSETGTLDVATDGYTAATDATILVVKDGANLANLAASDIVYIDQVETTATTQTYENIPIKDRVESLNAAGDNITAINVYIGGEEVTSAVAYVADNAEAGTTVSAISLADEGTTDPVTYTYTAAFTDGVSAFASKDAALAAAITVTKTGSDNTTVTLQPSDYTKDTATEGIIKILVGGEVVASVTYTIASTPAPGDKTAIAGTVKRNQNGSPNAAKGATVLITSGTDVVGVTATDADGNFEIEVPAGTGYRAIINFIRFTSANTYATYAPQVIKDITVTEGATTTIQTDDLGYVYCADVVQGDFDGDGDVDSADYGTFATNFTGAK